MRGREREAGKTGGLWTPFTAHGPGFPAKLRGASHPSDPRAPGRESSACLGPSISFFSRNLPAYLQVSSKETTSVACHTVSSGENQKKTSGTCELGAVLRALVTAQVSP